jgi:hypothetical protein
MFPRWLGPLVAALTVLVMVAVMVYMLGVAAHVWHSPPTGFWSL